jgi:HSP20 family protein
MDLQKLNPWNWFKHEEQESGSRNVPVNRSASSATPAYHPLTEFHRQIDRLFDNAFGGRDFFDMKPLPTSFNPDINVACDDREYIITLEAAGMDEKDINIELDDGRLLVTGKKEESKETREKHYYHMERRFGSFRRVLSLPSDADENSINANMAKGVLTIHIARKAVPAPTGSKRIEIGK